MQHVLTRQTLKSPYIQLRAVEWLFSSALVLTVALVITSGALWSATGSFATWYTDLFATEIEVEYVGPAAPERETQYVPGMGVTAPQTLEAAELSALELSAR